MEKLKDTIYQMNYTLYWDSDGNYRDSYQEAKENSDDGENVQVVRKGTRVIVKAKSELDGDLLDEFEYQDDIFDTAIISAKYNTILVFTTEDQIADLVAPIGERK